MLVPFFRGLLSCFELSGSGNMLGECVMSWFAWCVCMQVHPHLWDRLGDMYDNECIFDRLGCAVSPNGQHVVAGGYGELAVFNAATDQFSLLKTCVQPFTQNVRSSPTVLLTYCRR